jgi:GNAT superfamily N-acetyltransferase
MVTSKTQPVSVRTRPAGSDDAELVHALYEATPEYFDIISIPVPTVAEVRTDLETAAADPRRRIELVLLDAPAPSANGEVKRASQPAPVAGAKEAGGARDPVLVERATDLDPATGLPIAGYLDYKLDYPDPGDATVNLLLVRGGLQSRGIGGACALDLESRLRGRARRLLASIYGENPRARRFWENLGYVFAIDARPILDWYAKQLD